MIENITPQQAHTLLKSGDAVLIDVREEDEFKAEHIPYALSLPLSSFDVNFAKLDLPKDRTLVFQCLKGGRSQSACVRVEGSSQGFDHLKNIEGGILAWKAAGLPLVGGEGEVATPKLSIFRQVQVIVGALVALLVLLGFAGLTLGFVIAGLLGGALLFAGVTGWCGLAMLLQKMPWNK